MDAVLGAPFSHSTFVYFEGITGRSHRDAAADGHEYYVELYQPDTVSSREIASALFLVLESTYVTPWDFAIPGDERRRGENVTYLVPELNMTLDWRWISALHRFHRVFEEIAESPQNVAELDLPV